MPNEDGKMKNIGVLAVQGAVTEHIDLLNKIENVNTLLVKYEEDLDKIDGLIIPGGESTAIGRLLRDFNLFSPLKKKIEAGLPVFGTCAGMIILAKSLVNDPTTHLAVMDIKVARNAYGRQLGSFTTEVKIKELSSSKIPLVFIRAPYVVEAGPEVEEILTLDQHLVACRERNMLVTSFHPELTHDLTFHQYFLNMIKK